MDVDHVPDDSHFVSIANVGRLNQTCESREDQKVILAQKHIESTEGCDNGTQVQSDSAIGHGEFGWQHTLAVISEGSTGHGLSQGASCGEPVMQECVNALLESELMPTGNVPLDASMFKTGENTPLVWLLGCASSMTCCFCDIIIGLCSFSVTQNLSEQF